MTFDYFYGRESDLFSFNRKFRLTAKSLIKRPGQDRATQSGGMLNNLVISLPHHRNHHLRA